MRSVLRMFLSGPVARIGYWIVLGLSAAFIPRACVSSSAPGTPDRCRVLAGPTIDGALASLALVVALVLVVVGLSRRHR